MHRLQGRDMQGQVKTKLTRLDVEVVVANEFIMHNKEYLI